MRHALVVIIVSAGILLSGWGFHAHQEIHRLSVFMLPPEMIGFYKKNIRRISESAVDADRRRYAVEGEAARHYIDLDRVDTCMLRTVVSWDEAKERYGEDSLMRHGIVPWQIVVSFYQLREAFLLNDRESILRASADLGHYCSDASVPLHTTSNYNGQRTGQLGIHALWESRLPELFDQSYDFFQGPATYVRFPLTAAWQAVWRSHAAVDSVLGIEASLGGDEAVRYAYEMRGKQTVRVYAVPYAERYHHLLSGMVERQMRSSIRLTANLWFTAWVDAGQPDLDKISDQTMTVEALRNREEELKKWKEKTFTVRDHLDDD